MTVWHGEDRYVDLIRAYWFARGYIVEPYVASIPTSSGHNYQGVRSNMVNGLPHPNAKVDAVKVDFNVVGDDAFLLKKKKTS